MMLTGCSDADSNGSKNRTTTSTTAVSEEVSSSAETTTTSAPQDSSSETETTTKQTEVTTTTTPEPDSSEPEPETKAVSDIKCDSSRISSAQFGVDVSYPDGWEVKSYELKDDKPSQTAATVFNDDLGVSSTVELIVFDDGKKVSCDDYLEKLKQAYTELTAPDEGDPMSVSDVTIDEGEAGKAKTIHLSYTQRGVKSYIYTFVFGSESRENSFLQFTYAFSDSDNTEHIKTALEEMMSR